MELAMIGLSRMGTKMVRRLTHDGHECVVCDLGPEVVHSLAKDGAVRVTSHKGRGHQERAAETRKVA